MPTGPPSRGSAIRVLGFEGMTRCYRSVIVSSPETLLVFGAASGITFTAPVLVGAFITFGIPVILIVGTRPVIAVAGILVVAGPVLVSVARGAVVLTAFVLGIGVLVLVLLVVIRLLGRLLVRGLVLGVVAVAAVAAARTAVAAARGAGLGCGRLVRVLRLGLVGQFTASGELLDLLTLERLLHVVGPDLHREGSAGDLSASAVGADRHFLAVDLAVEDDGGREIRGVAGEPGGLVLVRGTGLARCRAAEVLRVASRTAVDDLLQSVRGLGGNGLVEDALALGIGLVHFLVLGSLSDLLDRMGVVVDTVRGEGRIRGGHIDGLHTGRAQHVRRVRGQTDRAAAGFTGLHLLIGAVAAQACPLRHIDGLVRSDLDVERSIGGVDRGLGRLEQADRAVARIAEVVDRPRGSVVV